MNTTQTQSYAGFPALNIENGYMGGRLCIMAASGNPGSDAFHVATCNDSRYARLFASAPRLLSALDHLQAGPNDAANHRRALDAMAEARGETVKDSGLPADVAPAVSAPALVLVLRGEELVNVEFGRDAAAVARLAGRLEAGSSLRTVVVPLGLVLRAGEMPSLIKRLYAKMEVRQDTCNLLKEAATLLRDLDGKNHPHPSASAV